MHNTKELAAELLQTMNQFSNRIHSKKQEFPIKRNEMLVLRCIGKHYEETGCWMNPSQISEKLGLSRPYITPVLDSLEEKQYITRSLSSEDRRKFVIVLTDKGYEMVKIIFAIFNRFIYKLIEGLGEENSKELIRLMQLCLSIMNSINETNHKTTS